MKRLVVFCFCLMIFGTFIVREHVFGAGTEEIKPEMADLEKHLEENAKLGVRAVDFPQGLDWFNVSKPLHMENLKGKVVLLDFWTFCCINCMHVIPELKRLEEKHPNELAVIGVHSAKFANERDSENIRQSILRYELKHPVVNDPKLLLWQAYGVRAWPTLVLIDPEGRVVISISGEGHYDLLDQAVHILIERAESKGVLSRNPIPIAYEEVKDSDSFLRFPGKVFADEKNLIVADSNHNRILILDYSGKVLEAIGSGEIGSQDGSFDKAEFNHPQGIFRDDNLIYVADTENHLIREIDLKQKTVKTIAGTGVQGGYLHGRAVAGKTSLNSPWDLVKVEDHLYIAMAGAHQIWTLDLKNGELDLFAGSGREDIADGRGASSALAQPSGITFDGVKTFYFADSEVSAVRSVDLKSREVKTLIGRGLFDFGDKDGRWGEALLQHPLGVSYTNGMVYVADTYNDKVKAIHLKDKTIRTIAGSAVHGLQDGKPGALYEPGGLSVGDGSLFVADTNHHAIRILNLVSGELSALQIKSDPRFEKQMGSGQTKTGFETKNPFLQVVEYLHQTLADGAQASVNIELPKDHEFTEGVPLHFRVHLLKEGEQARNLKEGELPNPSKELPMTFDLGGGTGSKSILEIELEVPYCTTVSPKLCKFKSLKLIQPVSFEAEGKSKLELRAQIQ